MRKFIDLHLKKFSDASNELGSMCKFAHDLGYSAVAVSSGEDDFDELKSLCNNIGLDLIRRIDLRPKSVRNLTTSLRRVRRSFEIVAVECYSKAVARQAARDHRVDILNFPAFSPKRMKIWFDPQEATLASTSNCAYELNLSELLKLEASDFSRLLYITKLEIENAKRNRVPMVISSGADSRLMMREPRALAAVLELVDVDEQVSLEMISTIPWNLVCSNREKLSDEFISPGVKKVE